MPAALVGAAGCCRSQSNDRRHQRPRGGDREAVIRSFFGCECAGQLSTHGHVCERGVCNWPWIYLFSWTAPMFEEKETEVRPRAPCPHVCTTAVATLLTPPTPCSRTGVDAADEALHHGQEHAQLGRQPVVAGCKQPQRRPGKGQGNAHSVHAPPPVPARLLPCRRLCQPLPACCHPQRCVPPCNVTRDRDHVS